MVTADEIVKSLLDAHVLFVSFHVITNFLPDFCPPLQAVKLKHVEGSFTGHRRLFLD